MVDFGRILYHYFYMDSDEYTYGVDITYNATLSQARNFQEFVMFNEEWYTNNRYHLMTFDVSFNRENNNSYQKRFWERLHGLNGIMKHPIVVDGHLFYLKAKYISQEPTFYEDLGQSVLSVTIDVCVTHHGIYKQPKNEEE
jgi:uncharacterized protein YwqG